MDSRSLIMITIMITVILMIEKGSCSSAYSIETYNFTGSSDTYPFAVRAGAVSGSLYSLNRIYVSSVYKTAIRRINPDNSLNWTKAIDAFASTMKTLDVGPSEQTLCFGNGDIGMKVVCMQTSDGTVTSAVRTNSYGYNDLTKINILSDNSGYFFSSNHYGISNVHLCKYLFSASSAQCQLITSLYQVAWAELMINDNQFFVLGKYPSSPYPALFLKVTAGNTAVDWATKMTCDGSGCAIDFSECLLDSSNSYIYSLIKFNNSTSFYNYFLTLSVSDGSLVGSRYKSNADLGGVVGSARVGNYLFYVTNNFLMMVDTNTFTFNLKKFSSMSGQWGAAAASGMFVVTAKKSATTGYITKFLPTYFDTHSDLISTSYTMDLMSPGTNSIVPLTGITISNSAPETATSFTPTPYTSTYVQISIQTVEAAVTSVCGDGLLDTSDGENCDDKNIVSGDGCSSTCQVENGYQCSQSPTTNISVCSRLCGNGHIDSSEECDDENLTNGDGCSSSCLVENGYECNQSSTSSSSVCTKVCGNGKIDSSEQCDDGNVINMDGCNDTCQIEKGYECTVLPSKGNMSYCSRVCGNSKINDGEQCDDGNYNLGDGCNAQCGVESGYKCNNFSNKPSFCYPICGDGKRDGAPYNEECDDGNNIDLDGCSGKCKVENNYICSDSSGIDVCVTTYSPPVIKSATFDSKSFQITIEFDQIMKKQNLTDMNMIIDISGENSPYTVSWSANFDKKNLMISFSSFPVLLGGIGEVVRLQLIDVTKFTCEHDISMLASSLFTFNVGLLPASDSVKNGGSSASYMFIFIMLMSIGVSFITGGSIELMWSLANTLQILYYYGVLDLNYTPELSAIFSYMKYSNFDNPIFEFIRDKAMSAFSFVQASLPSDFGYLGYSSVSVIINFFDKLIIICSIALFTTIIFLLFLGLKNKSNKFANFIKKKDIDIRYEGLSRFFMELSLNLSVVCIINLLYGNFRAIFSAISFYISILLTLGVFFMIVYCLAYPVIYYSEICAHPNFHERHSLLFQEFNSDKQRNLYFYFYFILHRFIFAVLLICMYSFPVQQCVTISYLNSLFLIYTFKMYKSCLQNFLHTFNCVVLFFFSILLLLFVSPSDPNKLKYSGYLCVGFIVAFFCVNWLFVFPQIVVRIWRKLRKCCYKKTAEETEKKREIDSAIRLPKLHNKVLCKRPVESFKELPRNENINEESKIVIIDRIRGTDYDQYMRSREEEKNICTVLRLNEDTMKF